MAFRALPAFFVTFAFRHLDILSEIDEEQLLRHSNCIAPALSISVHSHPIYGWYSRIDV